MLFLCWITHLPPLPSCRMFSERHTSCDLTPPTAQIWRSYTQISTSISLHSHPRAHGAVAWTSRTRGVCLASRTGTRNSMNCSSAHIRNSPVIHTSVHVQTRLVRSRMNTRPQNAASIRVWRDIPKEWPSGHDEASNWNAAADRIYIISAPLTVSTLECNNRVFPIQSALPPVFPPAYQMVRRFIYGQGITWSLLCLSSNKRTIDLWKASSIWSD